MSLRLFLAAVERAEINKRDHVQVRSAIREKNPYRWPIEEIDAAARHADALAGCAAFLRFLLAHEQHPSVVTLMGLYTDAVA